MTARANTSSGPKADGLHPVAYAIVSGVAVGLLLPVIGFLLDPHDTYFSALLPASLAGGAIVAFEPNGPFESGGTHVNASNVRPKDVWTPESKHLIPFGPGGVGQWTAHPIGLVIVIGLVLMGLVSRTEVSSLMFFSLLGGAVVGICLWLYHRR
jgi:hypothetical protein